MGNSSNVRKRKSRALKRVALWMAQGGRCYYCSRHMVLPLKQIKGQSSPANMATLDHMLPRSRGGTLTYGNTVLACHSCNCDKGSLTAAEYLDLLDQRRRLAG